MDRDTGTTMKPIMLVSAFGHSILATQSSWPFCAVPMYLQLGHVRMYMDFRVWRNNYGILATNVNPVTAPWSGAITAEDNWPQCTASCSL